MSGRSKYIEEFKRDAVSQVKDRGYSVKDVAERLGICTKYAVRVGTSISGGTQF